MLSKAIATGFNSPFVSIPGSGFAQTFIGMDAVIVRWLAWKAKRLARKWGGQCIVFIDEIDAVGMRRQSLGPAGGFMTPLPARRFEELAFYGPWGSVSAGGDLILETRAWRDRLFTARAPEPRSTFLRPPDRNREPDADARRDGRRRPARAQPAARGDGRDRQPALHEEVHQEPLQHVPRRDLRGPAPGRQALSSHAAAEPRSEQIYFIGASNVPIESLDPALIRPGRLGRHVWFRTPTKHDRLDIFDLYIDKVSHARTSTAPQRRDEIARITNGYSPAMIEQVCSMALTIAHHDGRPAFEFEDLFEAMTTVESGTAVNVEYVPEETRAVAIHEAGHAVASHVYMKDAESTRLSIRMRGAVARPPPGAGEGGALLEVALGADGRADLGARRDGRRARLLRRELDRGRRRRAELHGARRLHGRRLRDGAGADRAERRLQGRRRAQGSLRQDHEAVRGDRAPDHEPHRLAHDPIWESLGDTDKRKAAAQILGQAYVKAHNLIEHNKEAVARIADVVVARREIYGDELLDLLKEAKLTEPEIDYTEEKVWPKL